MGQFAALITLGMSFQSLGALTANALSPLCINLGTIRDITSEDLRKWEGT